MRHPLFAAAAIILVSATPVLGQAPTSSQNQLGIGAQASFPVFGASVMYNTPSGLGLQGIVGLVGDLKEYGGRVLYRFATSDSPRPYVYGLLGMWSYTGYTASGYSLQRSTETVPGFGLGGGVEYFFSGMPSLGFNAEIGIGSVKFKQVDYNFSMMTFGGGVHYYLH